jgi:pimeloyl-ACP methyl ester carboxylesterase
VPTVGRITYLEALPPASVRKRGTLVLLHAFPLNAHMWLPQLALAGSGWRVVAPHARGMAGTYGSAVNSIDDYAGDVIDFLDGLHIDDAVIAGLSMGGYVAFAVMRHAASYFGGLVLADTRSQADTPEGLDARHEMLRTIDEKGAAGVADEMIPKLLGPTTTAGRPHVVERVRQIALENSPESLAGAVRALMSRPDSGSLLPSIHVPTLIVVGEEDGITPPAAAEEMHARIAGSELARLPQCGHLSSLEQPEAFNAVLAHFLDHRV